MASLYNTTPDHILEVNEHEFGRKFFHYVFKKRELRQPTDRVLPPELGNLYLFEIDYNDWEGLGVAMAHDFWGKKVHYFIYGDPERWKINEGKFAAQFAGDNS